MAFSPCSPLEDRPTRRHSVVRRARIGERWIRLHGGWPRILRNTVKAYFEQAGSRMAAALSYYSIFVGGPVLVLTLVLGSALFGEELTKDAIAQVIQRILPPGAADVSQIADDMVRTSTPTISLALIAGLASLGGFTRALSTCLNVTLKLEGTETLGRTFYLGPLLLVAVLGLLWGAWALKPAFGVLELMSGGVISNRTHVLLDGVAPLLLAILYLSVILRVVPRAQLTWQEVLVPAICGAVLWESARHLCGAALGSNSAYLRVFGPLGGVVALLGWVYLSSAILVLTGQLAWAYAMERRGRGGLAYDFPRQAGLEGWMPPFEGDNAVNEDHAP